MAVRSMTRTPGEPSRHARTLNPAEVITHVEHEIDRCPIRALVGAVRETGLEAIPLRSAVVSRPSE